MKKASKNDLEDILDIEMNSGLDFPIQRNEKKMKKYFKRRFKEGEIFFLYDDLGFVSIIKDYEDGAQINYLSVKQKHHGKGIGTKLMKKAENFIKEKLNKNKAYVYCWIKNNKALKFYFKLGYKITDYKDNRYSWGDPALILSKNLK